MSAAVDRNNWPFAGPTGKTPEGTFLRDSGLAEARRGRQNTQNNVRAKSNYTCNFNARHSVQSPYAKIFCFPSVYQQRIYTPSTPPRGVSRSSRTRSWMRWPRPTSLTRDADVDGQAVWFWLPDAGVKLRKAICAAMVAKKPGTPGRARSSRKTIAQGMPDCFGVPVLASRASFSFARKAVGAASTRHSLLPLSRDANDAELGQIMPRECFRSSLRPKRSNPFPRLRRDGLLRRCAPRNDDFAV
jgi:hypothetical protein